MFGKYNYNKVTKTKEKRTRNGDVSDLANCKDETAKEAYYIYQRANYSQRLFLNSVLTSYIVIESVVEITDCDRWDCAEERVLSKKISIFDPPYSIRKRIREIYIKMINCKTATIKEQIALEEQRKLDEGFDNFFKN